MPTIEAWRGCVLAALLSGCGGEIGPPRPQWRVEVITDASIPQVGDRLLIEVLDDQGQLACAECRRQFGVLSAEQWDFSFGVVPPDPAARFRVRARLYRSSRSGPDGLPEGTSLIDAVGLLPLPAPVREERVVLSLALACFGMPTDLMGHRTCDPSAGELVPERLLEPRVEQPLEQPLDNACPLELPTNMVCVSAGAFLIGNEERPAPSAAIAPAPERLVTVGSFALDAKEVTVGQVRTLILAGAVDVEPVPRDPDDSASYGACTYLGASDGSNDDLPINCISAPDAAAMCEALGKRLPTEAEWEFAARSRGLDLRYPWGDDDDICQRAVAGLGRYSLLSLEPAYESTTCRRPEAPDLDTWGPRPSGSLPDLTLLGLADLGGNVAEWTADAFAPYWEDCWSHGDPVLVDPSCSSPWTPPSPTSSPLRAARGGAWSLGSLQAETTARQYLPAATPHPSVGFRCALSL